RYERRRKRIRSTSRRSRGLRAGGWEALFRCSTPMAQRQYLQRRGRLAKQISKQQCVCSRRPGALRAEREVKRHLDDACSKISAIQRDALKLRYRLLATGGRLTG